MCLFIFSFFVYDWFVFWTLQSTSYVLLFAGVACLSIARRRYLMWGEFVRLLSLQISYRICLQHAQVTVVTTKLPLYMLIPRYVACILLVYCSRLMNHITMQPGYQQQPVYVQYAAQPHNQSAPGCHGVPQPAPYDQVGCMNSHTQETSLDNCITIEYCSASNEPVLYTSVECASSFCHRCRGLEDGVF